MNALPRNDEPALGASDTASKNDLEELQRLVERLARQQAEDRQTIESLSGKVKAQAGQIAALQRAAGIGKAKRPAGNFIDISNDHSSRLACRELRHDAVPALRREVLAMAREVCKKIEAEVKLEVSKPSTNEPVTRKAKTPVIEKTCWRIIAEMSSEALLGSEQSRKIQSNQLRLTVKREIDRLWAAESAVRVSINNAKADAEQTMSDLLDAITRASDLKEKGQDATPAMLNPASTFSRRHKDQGEEDGNGVPVASGIVLADHVDGHDAPHPGNASLDTNDEGSPDDSSNRKNGPSRPPARAPRPPLQRRENPHPGGQIRQYPRAPTTGWDQGRGLI